MQPASSLPQAGKRPRRQGEQPYHEPRTVDELTAQNIAVINRLERMAQNHRQGLDRLADKVSQVCGSSVFLIGHALLFSAWILLNTWTGISHWDPYPFTFLTLVVSLEAIFLASFILISQNQAARVSDRRNQLDLQINLLTEQENTKMLKLLEGIAKKLDLEIDDDPSLQVLEQATRPEKLAQQIERAARS